MPKGELYINKDSYGQWQDAFDTWGLSMTDMGLSALMAPAPNKEYVENESRLEHGKRVSTRNTKVAARELNLPVHITAKTKEEFFKSYLLFCQELQKGDIWIRTKYTNDIYKCVYLNCSSFTLFVQSMAHFTLRLVEPNPTDRE